MTNSMKTEQGMLRFVINLDHSVQRWESIKNKLDKFNIYYERVSAVDGRKLDINKLGVIAKVNNLLCQREITPGEIGCFLSHRMCWEKLSASNYDFALIMEDDILFSDRAGKYISNTTWIPQGIDLIQLSTLFSKPYSAKVGNIHTLNASEQLIHPLSPVPWGTQAYLISRKAAQEAVRMSEKICAPVDDFLFNPLSLYALKFPVFRLNPAIITHDDLDIYKSTLSLSPSQKFKTKNNLITLALKCMFAIYLKIYAKNKTLYFL